MLETPFISDGVLKDMFLASRILEDILKSLASAPSPRPCTERSSLGRPGISFSTLSTAFNISKSDHTLQDSHAKIRRRAQKQSWEIRTKKLTTKLNDSFRPAISRCSIQRTQVVACWLVQVQHKMKTTDNKLKQTEELFMKITNNCKMLINMTNFVLVTKSANASIFDKQLQLQATFHKLFNPRLHHIIFFNVFYSLHRLYLLLRLICDSVTIICP